MSQKPETIFRRRVQDRLDRIPNSWFESIQQKAIAGTPDILGCINGFFVGLELKATSREKPTMLQALKLQRIVNAHGLGMIIHPGNLDNSIDLLNELARRKNAYA